MPRALLQFHFAIVATLCLFVSGCPGDDGPPPILGTTGGSGFTTGSDDEGGSEETGTGETGEPEPADACKPGAGPTGNGDPVREGPELLVLSEVCNYPELVDSTGMSDHKLAMPGGAGDENFNVYTWRPGQMNGSWPSGGPWTPIFVVPGNDQFAVDPGDPPSTAEDWYEELVPALADAGYVVFIGQPPTMAGLSSGKRMSMLACMMLWAQDAEDGWSRADEDKTAPGAVVAGTSRGGAAVNLLTYNFDLFQTLMAGMDEYELCGAVAIAPRWSDGSGDTATAIFNMNTGAPPYLVLQGALDPDTNGQGISAFDAMGPENDIDADPVTAGAQLAEARLHDKFLLWFYTVQHHEWGGTSELTTVSDQVADFAGAYYVEQFLEHQLHDDPNAYEALVLPMQAAPDPAAFPSALQSESLWEDVTPQYEDSGDGTCTCASPPCDCRRPLVYGNHLQGIGEDGAGRVIVDSLSRVDGSGDPLGLVCGDAEPADFLGPSSLGLPVGFSGFDESQLCHGPADSLGSATQTAWQRHQTRAVNVEWGETEPEGILEWVFRDGESPLNVSPYNYLTLRVANLADVTTGGTGEFFFCDQEAIDAFELTVELDSRTASGDLVTASLPLGPSVEQHNGSLSLAGVGVCPVSQHMREIRLPMRALCDQGQWSPSTLEALRVVFPEDATTAHAAMIDSIEFTRDPLDPAGTACGLMSASWNCEATANLTIQESSCDGEPTPTCAGGDQELDDVDLPVVSGSTNWVVHTPEGWVADLDNPTNDELEVIEGLCAQACALEWEGDDDIITSDCFTAGSFETPTLREVGTLGPVHRIPDEQEEGAGIFTSQSLACDLENPTDSCCELFDERLCAARPTRPTPASTPLQRGEEYRVTLGGTGTKITLATPGDSEDIALTGAAGYSFCPKGDTGITCPFYLGSLQASRQGSNTLSDTCPDQSQFFLLVGNLDLQLVQPTFGIASSSSFAKALPKGALHLRASFIANGQPFGVRAVNADEVVFMSAKVLTGLEVDNAVFEFELPCGSGTIPITATLDLNATSFQDQPPKITAITSPASVTCPGTLPLTATVSDADSDLASVRWYVDDVLITAGRTSIPMTQAHTLRAVARDDRGGATAKTKSVTCLPM